MFSTGGLVSSAVATPLSAWNYSEEVGLVGTTQQSMGLMWRLMLPAVALVVVLAACGAGPDTAGLDKDRAGEIAWQALEPNTKSHDRVNWTVVEVRRTSGRSVVDEFEGWTYHGACGGPEPPPNGAIEPEESYWYVEMMPRPATPSGPSMSATAPPLVPEPYMHRALFLIDEGGQVVARMLGCVVY